MEKSSKSNENEATSQKYITDAERKQLLSTLHSRLFWVGQRIPDYMEFKGKRYPLHNYVWQMIKKDTLTPEEKSLINKCIDIISAKEKENEKELEEKPLTVEEAKSLYHETAGLLRAIMDLKEIESGALKESTKRFQEQFIGQRVKDAKLWLEFIKKVSK
ncbi:MAG TPA: methyl-accepting chemotaxis protein [Methanosarcina sp.]|nr:methyl-accepting chemotaxis protein [Methanosarcina sp.]